MAQSIRYDKTRRPLPHGRGLGSESPRAGANPGLVRLLIVGIGFARGRDIFRTGLFEYVFSSADPIRIVAMHGQQDSSVLHQALIALGFVFRDTHSDESANEAADYPAGAGTRERSHNGTRSDEWPEARNRECSNSGQET